MKKMIVKNWKRIAAVIMAAIMVVGSVNLSELSASAEGGNNAPNVVGSTKLDDFTLYQFLTYYQYVIKEDATIGNHTVGSMLIGGNGTIGAFGEGAIAPVYVGKLLGSGNYAERYSELSAYYSGRVPAYFGKESTNRADGWNEWDSAASGDFINFTDTFSRLETESSVIAESYDVKVDYNASSGFSIVWRNGAATDESAVTVEQDSIQGKWGDLLTIDFSKFSGDNKTPRYITITEAAYQELDVIDILVKNIDAFNYPHNISILGDSVNVSYAYNPAMGTKPQANSAVCVTINGSTFQGGALKSMTGNTQGAQLLDAPMELLWNFPEAATATVEYLGGHVVAPKAALTIYGGNFEGGVIAKSVSNAGAEGHMYPYYGIPKTLETATPTEPILPEDPNNQKIPVTVPISIEKTFGDSNFSSTDERLGILSQTCFAVYNANNGFVQTIPYNQSNDTVIADIGDTANSAIYKGEFSFIAEKGTDYYFYLAEIKTDTARYKICNSRWAIKVTVNDDGNSDVTYVSYSPENISNEPTGVAALSGYASKTDSLEFVNTKINEETPTPGTAEFTIGLTKTYEDLNLSSLGDSNSVQAFLDDTDFVLIEVNENGQTVAGATANTLHPEWDGNNNNAVVSQKITITKGATRYYKLSETEASDGFEKSGDICIWKITCDDTGTVSAQYKMGDEEYKSYTVGDPYPTVTNARVPYSGTISLIKTYDGLDLSSMSEQERSKLLNGTTFALYGSANDGANQIGETHPVWENGQAVVKFELGDTAVGLDGKVYYIRETAASSGYVKSDVVYECRISNVNGQYEVGYRAGSSGTYIPAITCNNVKQTVRINPVTVEISKIFSDNFAGLSQVQITQLISETKFTFYDDVNLSSVNTNDFALQPGPANSSGRVAYIYNYERALKPGDHFTYYVEETDTNRSIYTMDNAVYKIEIAVGQPTVGVADQTITPVVTYTKVGGTNPVDNLSFTNTRIPKAQSPATITFTKVFTDISKVTDQSKIDGIISATRFTLYDAPGCGADDVVAGFSQPTTTRSDGNVTYEYSLVISSLDVDKTYYYYLKETNTDLNYYQRNDATYVVRIEIDPHGKPTVTYAKYTSSPESLSYSDTLTITNTQTPTGAQKVLNSPVISFTKEFEGFANYVDGSDIVKATTFTLTAADNAATIGFIRQTPDMNDKGATYYYQLDLSNLNADTYAGGTYYIKENGTDSRYTTSKEVLEINIELIDGEAKVTFVNGNTFHNTLEPDNPQPNPPVNNTSSSPGTPTTPNSPSTPSTPNSPSTPSTPTIPNSPSTPTTPTASTPGTPTTPSAPTTPDTPNTWITSDGKVHYEILIEYEHVDSSSAQERIEELITNTTIEIIDQDGNDVTENVTQITWDPSRNVAIVTVEAPKPSEGFDTYYVIEDTDPADNALSHSEPGKGFTVAITSEGKVLFQEDGSASPTTELRFVNVETSVLTSSAAGGSQTLTSMTSAQTGERRLPLAVFGGGMSMIFIAGVVYVFKKKEKIEE